MSLDVGYAAKAEGQAAAASKASAWMETAKAEILRRAEHGEEFTAEDITNAVGFPDESPGAVGTVFSHLARAKQIEWTGRITPCTRDQAHASDMRVWACYSGRKERNERVLAVVEEFMQPYTSSPFSKSKAEIYPALFQRRVREAWGS